MSAHAKEANLLDLSLEELVNDRLTSMSRKGIYSPMYSGVLWQTRDTLMEDFERIEVIRVPGAALGGANAMNGVINIAGFAGGTCSLPCGCSIRGKSTLPVQTVDCTVLMAEDNAVKFAGQTHCGLDGQCTHRRSRQLFGGWHGRLLNQALHASSTLGLGATLESHEHWKVRTLAAALKR